MQLEDDDDPDWLKEYSAPGTEDDPYVISRSPSPPPADSVPAMQSDLAPLEVPADASEPEDIINLDVVARGDTARARGRGRGRGPGRGEKRKRVAEDARKIGKLRHTTEAVASQRLRTKLEQNITSVEARPGRATKKIQGTTRAEGSEERETSETGRKEEEGSLESDEGEGDEWEEATLQKGKKKPDAKKLRDSGAQHSTPKKERERAGVMEKEASKEQQDPKGQPKGQPEGVEGKEGSGVPRGKLKALASSIPLMLPDRVHRSKVVVECEGETLDLSGDVGAVGRVSVRRGSHTEVILDLKGSLYSTRIVPCGTLMVVNVGPTEAKVEAIVNNFVQLQEIGSAQDTETLLEGTLEGFQFGSDEEEAAGGGVEGGGEAVRKRVVGQKRASKTSTSKRGGKTSGSGRGRVGRKKVEQGGAQ